MSCNCLNNTPIGQSFVCYCDQFIHPPALHVGAGLPTLPRQIATFPAFRRAMLASLHREEPTDDARRLSSKSDLNSWQARRPDDLGVMLLEMWAYVCDAVSFYDQVIANETYLRTAQQRPSIRRLVGLLGYLPRPAVASLAQLTALAEGRQSVPLPAGTAFRSGAFGANPPQVFELDADTIIHPLTNQWTVRPPRPTALLTANPALLVIRPETTLLPDQRLLLIDPQNTAQSQPVQIRHVVAQPGPDGQTYTYLTLTAPARLQPGTVLGQLRVFRPAQTASLWTLAAGSVLANQVVLDGLYRHLKTGDYVLISRQTETRWYQLTQVGDVTRQQSPGDPIRINQSQFVMPGISTTVTILTLDVPLNDPARKNDPDWTDAQRAELTLHYQMLRAGTLTNEQKTTLGPTDPIQFAPPAETPADPRNPAQFALTDRNERGVLVGGQLNWAAEELNLDQNTGWQPELTMPVTAFGNVIGVSRGERVLDEVLGNGDASATNQSFTLKKKPLTYLPAANEQGFQTTLRVFVNGLRWTEVSSFYGQLPDSQAYIVRQTDDADSVVTFGDGIRGSRLPSGAGNVIASYRFGAGKASPPARSVNQIARPVKGLQRVLNPLAAVGGADADTAAGMQTYAPKSALLLGRAVSMPDLEAATLAMPGVLAAQVEWRWHGSTQGPVVLVSYVGEAGVGPLVSHRLRTLSDPGLAIRVEQAQPRPTTLMVDIAIDPRRVETDVLADVRYRLTNPETGLLTPARLGIGKPLFRSQLFSEILAVEGAQTVRSLLINGLVVSEFSQTPGAGFYFDFGLDSLTLNGRTQP